jgi:hypothetical protein
MTKKYVNGELVDLTTEEENQLQTDISNSEIENEEVKTARENHSNLKASAKAKLMSGEALTEDEANTIVL